MGQANAGTVGRRLNPDRRIPDGDKPPPTIQLTHPPGAAPRWQSPGRGNLNLHSEPSCASSPFSDQCAALRIEAKHRPVSRHVAMHFPTLEGAERTLNHLKNSFFILLFEVDGYREPLTKFFLIPHFDEMRNGLSLFALPLKR